MPTESLLERSLLFREVLAEREEIMKHKWCESQKAGRDIGWDSALISWAIHHRIQWRRERQRQAARQLQN